LQTAERSDAIDYYIEILSTFPKADTVCGQVRKSIHYYQYSTHVFPKVVRIAFMTLTLVEGII